MNASSEQHAAARAYEGLHVPALFREWASRVLDAAQVGPGDRVLDVACGTGVLAREAMSRVQQDNHVAGLDVDPGMLAVARELEPRVDWRHGLADALPWEDESFDAVVSQFGLMFFPDRAAAVREMLRVSRARGRLAVAVWDALERSEAYPEEVALLERRAGPQAADALRAPFVLGDTDALQDLFKEAGASNVEVNTVAGSARFPSVRTMVEADLRGWLPIMGVQLEDELIESILDDAERELAGYVQPDGSVCFRAPAHIVTAHSP